MPRYLAAQAVSSAQKVSGQDGIVTLLLQRIALRDYASHCSPEAVMPCLARKFLCRCKKRAGWLFMVWQPGATGRCRDRRLAETTLRRDAGARSLERARGMLIRQRNITRREWEKTRHV